MSAPSSYMHAIYMHAIDGRLRIKVPVIKGSPARAGQLERALAMLSGVQCVKANPTTGNVLVLFDSQTLSQEQVIQKLAEMNCLVPVLHGRHSSRPIPFSGRVAETIVQSALQIALERVILALV
jgi:copper chaperone CopZ